MAEVADAKGATEEIGGMPGYGCDTLLVGTTFGC